MSLFILYFNVQAGFTPLHLSAQEGHTDMSTLLIEHKANVNAHAKVIGFF